MRGNEKTVTWKQTLQGDEARRTRHIQEGVGGNANPGAKGQLSSKDESNVLLERWLSVVRQQSGVRRPAPGVRVTSRSSVVWWLKAIEVCEWGVGCELWSIRDMSKR